MTCIRQVVYVLCVWPKPYLNGHCSLVLHSTDFKKKTGKKKSIIAKTMFLGVFRSSGCVWIVGDPWCGGSGWASSLPSWRWFIWTAPNLWPHFRTKSTPPMISSSVRECTSSVRECTSSVRECIGNQEKYVLFLNTTQTDWIKLLANVHVWNVKFCQKLFFHSKYICYTLVDYYRSTVIFLSVGGGTSGSVLASRLSESPDVSVLLLEAGGLDSDPDLRLPLLSSLERKPEHTWKFTTTPQEHAFKSLEGKVITCHYKRTSFSIVISWSYKLNEGNHISNT